MHNGAGDHLYTMDRDQQVTLDYRVKTLGETVFIDRQGQVAGRCCCGDV